MDKYSIIISPETIVSDFVQVTYSGVTFGVYTGMSEVLSGGTNGNSILSGLTIPILLKETINDIGYYDPFDGEILQADAVTNFIFSSETQTPFVVNIYNTSNEYKKFLDLSDYYIDWGDGSPKQRITNYTPNFVSHTYPSTSNISTNYTIILEQQNPFGTINVKKEVTLPYKKITAGNPNGTAYFISNIGNWSATPISYDYIFSGDAENKVSKQISSNYTTVPFTVSGVTKSRINDFLQYGSVKFPPVNVPIIKDGQVFGAITNITTTYTAYTISNVDYYDYSDGSTLFFISSSGQTSDNITESPITKQEVLLNVIDQPQIQTNIFVERGKNSAYERIQRLGEVDNLGDMVNYGYGFFNVEKKI